ncbi:MAG: hypothetical protein A2070_04115 [Bdellovibrionales bacterium GWC1_52_8]|nr:MAG: hypothetical protein A2070_04115 [Bdellovibrionales bacterium GWC1_52_8]
MIKIANAAPSPSPLHNEVMVTLFGQPCLLAGPLDKDVLKAIHTISPEQTFIDPSTPSADSIHKVIEKIRNTKNTPSWLENYRVRRLKRLEALFAFTNGLSSAKAAKKSEPLLNAVKPLLSERLFKKFLALASEVGTKKSDPNFEIKLMDSFSEMIEPDPEEDFHRSIRRMNVRYSCEFADEGDSHDESSDEPGAP